MKEQIFSAATAVSSIEMLSQLIALTIYPINIVLGVCLFFAEKDEETSLGGRNCCFLFARV